MAELTDKERDLLARAADNPMDVFQGKSLGWLEDFIRITVGTSGSGTGRYVAGDSKVILKDLTAETSAYVYEDESGQWLYCNGAAVSQTTYADLYAFFGANAFAADSGGNFTLPDCRGRAMFMCGTHADTDLGDNDGTALASRGAKHIHTASVTGAPGAGTLAVASHTHTYVGTDGSSPQASAGSGLAIPSAEVQTLGTAPAITGAPSAGTLGVGVGSGGSTDAPSHLFVGSLLVRF